MYYIVFCVIAILVVSATVGLWRGLFRSLFGLVALILCIFITYLVIPITNLEVFSQKLHDIIKI